MICPKCKERTRNKVFKGECSSCGYQYVFGVSDTFKDNFFETCINIASRKRTEYFTLNQAYSAHLQIIQKQNNRTKAGKVFFSLVSGFVLFIALFLQGDKVFIIVVGIIFAISLLSFTFQKNPEYDEEFRSLFLKYIERNPEEKLVLKAGRLSQPPPEFPEKDLYSYGVENILVVDDEIVVDLLVLNELHTREKCLIISQSGYPSYLVNKAKSFLVKDPQLKVTLIHGVSLDHKNYADDQARITEKLLAISNDRIENLSLDSQKLRSSFKNLDNSRWQNPNFFPLDRFRNGLLMSGIALCLGNELAFGEAIDQIRRDSHQNNSTFG